MQPRLRSLKSPLLKNRLALPPADRPQQLAGAAPQRIHGFAFVHAARDCDRILYMVREAVEHVGFVGIKVHRHDARLSGEVCEAARAFGLPVPYDPADEVAVAELLARQYPDVKLHLAAPGQLCRRLGRATGLDRPPGAPADYLHRQFRRAPL